MNEDTAVTDAAAMLGVSEAQVRNLLSQGVLEGVKVGRDWSVSVDSINLRKESHGKVSRRRRTEVLIRDGGKCQKCGSSPELKFLHVHHVKERQNGGDNSIENLTLLCIACHRLEHGMTEDYQEPKTRTIRLDDDVYEALRKLPESPNKFLRKVLSADGAFGLTANMDKARLELSVVPREHLVFSEKPITNYRREIRPKGDGKR